MKLHPAIRIFLVAFMTLVLCAPVVGAAGPAAPTTPTLYFLFHPQFIKSDAGASSTLYLENPLAVAADAQLEFYTASGDLVTIAPHPDLVTMAPHNVRIVAGEDLSALPNGTYSLVISSTEQVQSVVRTLETGAPERLIAFRGQSWGMTTLRFGPVYKNTTGLNSAVSIMNVGNVPTQAIVQYRSNEGDVIVDPNVYQIPLNGSTTLSNVLLPAGFAGWARITSTQPLVGILELSDSAANTVMEVKGPLSAEAVTASVSRDLTHPDQVTAPLYRTWVPRVLKHSNQGTGPRSTTLFVGNTGAFSAHAEVTFYDSGGSVVFNTPIDLPAEGATSIQLVDLGALPDGAWAVCLTADSMLVIGELTTLDSAGSANETTYDAPLTNGLVLPRLVSDGSAHTIFTVQNTGDAAGAVTVRLYSLTGGLIYEDTVTLSSLGWKTYDQSQIPELSAGFAGSGEVTSAVPLIALVDELVSRPAAIADLDASNATGKVKLDWTEVLLDTSGQSITGVMYNVYRAQGVPYFLPSVTDAAYAPGLTGTTFTDSDATVMTDVAHNTYYVVKAVYQDMLSKPGNRAGVFVFGLVPGS